MSEDPVSAEPTAPARQESTLQPSVNTWPDTPLQPNAAGSPVTAEPGDEAPSPRVRTHWRGGSRRQALYFIVLLMLLVGLLLVAVNQWRKGLVVMGSSILLGGAARAVLPTRLVGWLAVRNRTSDLVFCVAFGVLLIVTAIVARG